MGKCAFNLPENLSSMWRKESMNVHKIFSGFHMHSLHKCIHIHREIKTAISICNFRKVKF